MVTLEKESNMEPDEFDMHAEEQLWPTVEEPETWEEPSEDDLTDAEADGDTLASAGMGTDEDYGSFGGEDDYLDGSYEE